MCIRDSIYTFIKKIYILNFRMIGIIDVVSTSIIFPSVFNKTFFIIFNNFFF